MGPKALFTKSKLKIEKNRSSNFTEKKVISSCPLICLVSVLVQKNIHTPPPKGFWGLNLLPPFPPPTPHQSLGKFHF